MINKHPPNVHVNVSSVKRKYISHTELLKKCNSFNGLLSLGIKWFSITNGIASLLRFVIRVLNSNRKREFV